jgi:TrmH family RNA methyltransferase
VLVPAGQPSPEGLDAELVSVEPGLLDQVSALGSGSRMIAVWELPADPPPPAEGVLQVYLDGVADPGNVGTIVRTAEALCGARVILGGGCADPYGPKSVRASMGALFAEPPLAMTISETPQPRLGLDAHGGGDLDTAIASAAPRTVCFGAERAGLGAEAISACDAVATIPVAGVAESLNVAATAAIVLHRISSTAPPGRPGNS